VIDADVLAELRRLIPLAPLHQPHNVGAIEAVLERLPGVPQVACFDTSFHRGQPAVAELVPLPRELRDKGLQRYGFHGLSYEYIASALPQAAPEIAAGRVVVAHLGSGASLCALRGGKSVDSSLGFTALDGLCMGTRPGTLDPGVVLHLFQGLGLTAQQVEQILYKKSGLLGVSGISNDTRGWPSTISSTRPPSRSARLRRRSAAWTGSCSPPGSGRTRPPSGAASARPRPGSGSRSTRRPTRPGGRASRSRAARYRRG
jgi:acetate kinase